VGSGAEPTREAVEDGDEAVEPITIATAETSMGASKTYDPAASFRVTTPNGALHPGAARDPPAHP